MEEWTLETFAEQALHLAGRRSEQAEVFSIESVETPVQFEANRLKQLETRETRGVALRVIVNGQVGLASTTLLESPAKLVEDAVAVAQLGRPVSYRLPAQTARQSVALFDPAVEALTVEKMVELGQQMIDRARAENSQLLCEANLEKRVSVVRLANSQGAAGGYRKSTFAASLDVNLIRGTDMLDVWESHVSCRWEFSPQMLTDRVLEKVRLAECTASIPTAQLPVILSPKGAAGTLLNALASGFNGKMVLEGASPVGNKLGQRAFSPRLTLYDDGLIEYGPASAPFDDEGSPTQRTALIQAGVVSAFIYDLQTAALAGAQTTGNASRSLHSLPSPALHTPWIEPGEASLEEMVADIEDGLLVDQVMGAWAGNVLAGEFAGNVHLGFRIENGRLVGRVKDTMVAGNVFQALSDIAAIGKELHWVGGAMQLPYLYLPALGVASKT